MKITVDGVKRFYTIENREFAAVDNISLEIPDNCIFGIIGKSGVGKSTLVRLISLLEKPNEGKILFGDERVDNLSGRTLIEKRRRIGMIFQNFNLFFSRNAFANVAYPLELEKMSRDKINSRVSELLNLVGLSERAKSPISALSGGQRQRVAIARALANNPDILFCDEATSALDPQTTHSILRLIRQIRQEMNLTVVMVTHQMEVVRDACDFVAVLDEGRVVEQGRVSDVFSSPKSKVTRELLSHIDLTERESEENGGGDVDRESPLPMVKRDGTYILYFAGDQTEQPLLCRAAKQFDVDFNIRGGGIQHLVEKDVGMLVVDIIGDKGEVNKTVQFLKDKGVGVESTVEGEESNGI